MTGTGAVGVAVDGWRAALAESGSRSKKMCSRNDVLFLSGTACERSWVQSGVEVHGAAGHREGQGHTSGNAMTARQSV